MLLQKCCDLFTVHSTSSSRKYLLVFLFSYRATFLGLLVLHGHDMAVRAEFHIERALRTVKHRIPLELGQIFHRFPAVGAGRIFRVLYPVGKATHRVHILAGRTVKQGHRRFGTAGRLYRRSEEVSLFSLPPGGRRTTDHGDLRAGSGWRVLIDG